MVDPRSLDWCAIVGACIVSMACGVVSGVGLCMFMLVLIYCASPGELSNLFDGPQLAVAGFMASLGPEAAGGLYLSRTVNRNVLAHCFYFGVVSMLLSRSIGIVSGEFFLTWQQGLSYLPLIPAAVLGGMMGNDQ